MDRDTELQLIDRCMSLAKAKTRPIHGEEARVDVQRYADPARFEREMQRLFRGGLTVAAHASELTEPGDFVTRQIAGVPVLLVRDEDRVGAFINVCRHRGATVELRERGQCKRFVCPYHAWTYDRRGALVHLRQPEGFPSVDPSQESLVRLPCFEAGGLVWVAADPKAEIDFEAEVPTALVDELRWAGTHELEVFATDTRVWRANWKLLADGGLEAYHFRIAHRETIASIFLDNVSVFEFIGPHTRSVLTRADLPALADEPREQWRLRRCSNVLYSVFPNASLLVQADHVVMIQMTPLAVDQTRIVLRTLVPRGEREGSRPKYWRANHELTTVTLAEDFAMAERIQSGVTSGANEHYRLGRYESAIAQLHAIIDRRLGTPDSGDG